MVKPLKTFFFFNLIKYILKKQKTLKNYNTVFFNTIKNYYNMDDHNMNYLFLYSYENIINFCFYKQEYSLLWLKIFQQKWFFFKI
jgi:hypothetical protein